MPQALPLTDRIDQASARQRTYRVLSAQRGDGYSQEAPDGINNRVDNWQISYSNLTASERNTLVTALDAVGGWDYLTWTANGDSTEKKWKVTADGWSEQTNGLHYNVSFTLRQVF